METGIFSLRRLASVSLDVLLEVFLCRNLSSVANGEIVILQIIVVLFRLWLTVCKRHNEEIRLEFFQYLALVDYSGNNFIVCRFS